MNNQHLPLFDDALKLRQLALERCHHHGEAGLTAFTDNLSSQDTQRLVHELQVHQIELQLQNEELHRLNTELEKSRNRYSDLYDMAPVGYCTLNEDWQILNANLTTATLLGIPRDQLHGQVLTQFISFDDQDIFYQMRRRFLYGDAAQSCELRMQKSDGTLFWAQLEVSRISLVKNGTTLHLIHEQHDCTQKHGSLSTCSTCVGTERCGSPARLA
jgi:PAS domain S-box-containing protein